MYIVDTVVFIIQIRQCLILSCVCSVVVCAIIIEGRRYLGLVEGVILSFDAYVIEINKGMRIFIYRMIIRIYIEQHVRQDTALWKTIILLHPSVILAI